jgi:hypothetical protein
MPPSGVGRLRAMAITITFVAATLWGRESLFGPDSPA